MVHDSTVLEPGAGASPDTFTGGSLLAISFPQARSYEQPSNGQRNPLKPPAKERFLVLQAQRSSVVHVQLTGKAG